METAVQLEEQCFKFDFDCLANPNNCSLTLAFWIKLEQSELNNPKTTYIFASGPGRVGLFILRNQNFLVAEMNNGEKYWTVNIEVKKINASMWTNIAVRWSIADGLQIFLQGRIADDYPAAGKVNENGVTYTAESTLVTIGCAFDGPTLKYIQHTKMTIDEIAIWFRRLSDSDLTLLTGAVFEEAQPIFTYDQNEIQELPLPQPAQPLNPVIATSDGYCDPAGADAVVRSGSASVVGGRGAQNQAKPAINLNDGSTKLEVQSITPITEELETCKDGASMSIWCLIPPTVSAGFKVIVQSGMASDVVGFRLGFEAEKILLTVQRKRNKKQGEVTTTDYVKDEFTLDDTQYKRNGWNNFAFSTHCWKDTALFVAGDIANATATTTVISNPVGRRKRAVGALSDPIYIGSDDVSNPTITDLQVSDITTWKRYLYAFETYRLVGNTADEMYLYEHANYFWTTDYFTNNDLVASGTSNPVYITLSSTTMMVPGRNSKGQALKLQSDQNGWAMLGGQMLPYLNSSTGKFCDECLSDPSRCTKGLSIGLWIKLDATYNAGKYFILSSGEQDYHSKGFSIYLENGQLITTVADGLRYWIVPIQSTQYKQGEWMHFGFSWSAAEGLWVFINGRFVLCNIPGLEDVREVDRYCRVLLGRENSDYNFEGYAEFVVEDIAAYEEFVYEHEFRKRYVLIDNEYYETADFYWNRDSIITQDLAAIEQLRAGGGTFLGPSGNVSVTDYAVSVGTEGLVHVAYINSGCLLDMNCPQGLTVSTWVRVIEVHEVDSPLNILRSVLDETKAGFSLGVSASETEGYMQIHVNIRSLTTLWNVTCSRLLPLHRWVNLGFSWDQYIGVTIYMDGKVAAKERDSYALSSTAEAATYFTVGDSDSVINSTNFEIYNIAVWQKLMYSSDGNIILGISSIQQEYYINSDYIWTFNGPLYDLARTRSTMTSTTLRQNTNLATSYKGAALSMSANGVWSSLGDFHGTCVLNPESCNGFNLEMNVYLYALQIDPVTGEAPTSYLVNIGAPEVGFQGLTVVQILRDDGVNCLHVYVANDHFVYQAQLAIQTLTWFRLTVGWNINQGIVLLVNGEAQTYTKSQKAQPTSKVLAPQLLLGKSSEGDVGFMNAEVDDVTLTFSTEVKRFPEGVCYDEVDIRYKMEDGEIYVMENVLALTDRSSIEGGTLGVRNGFIELDVFRQRCVSDPALCDKGLSVSLWVYIRDILSDTSVIISTGAPTDRGFSITVKNNTDGATAEATFQLHDGTTLWETVISQVQTKTWINLGFAWNVSTGLFAYESGYEKGNDTIGRAPNVTGADTQTTLMLGKSNSINDNYLDADFDDIGIWLTDLSVNYDVQRMLEGTACGVLEFVDPEQFIKPPEFFINITDTPPTLPPGCNFHIKGHCAGNLTDFMATFGNAGVINITYSDVEFFIEKCIDEYDPNQNGSTATQATLELSIEALKIVADDVVQGNGVLLTDGTKYLQQLVNLTSYILDKEEYGDMWYEIQETKAGTPSVIENFEKSVTNVVNSIRLDPTQDYIQMNVGAKDLELTVEKRRLLLCDISVKNLEFNGKGNLSASVTFPPEIFGYITGIDEKTMVTTSFVEYPGLHQFISLTTNPYQEDLIGMPHHLYSSIIGVTMDPPLNTTYLNDSFINITLEHTITNYGEKRNATCVFWNPDARGTVDGAWDTEGCIVLASNETHTQCGCTHLTTFAIMMEPPFEFVNDVHKIYRQYIFFGGMGFSQLCLVIFIILVLAIKSLRKVHRNIIHVNLSMAMILGNTAFLLSYVTMGPIFNQIVSMAQHYFYMAAYTWLFVEALSLFYLIVSGHLSERLKCYIPFAWILPAIPVAVTAAINIEEYGSIIYNWPSYDNHFIWAFVGPFYLMNFLQLSVLLIVLCNLPQPAIKKEDILVEIRMIVRSSILLTPIISLTWTFGVLSINAQDIAYSYVFAILHSLQGFFIFLVYCVGTKSIRQAVCSCNCKRKPKEENTSTSDLSDGVTKVTSMQNSTLSIDGLISVKPQPSLLGSPRSGSSASLTVSLGGAVVDGNPRPSSRSNSPRQTQVLPVVEEPSERAVSSRSVKSPERAMSAQQKEPLERTKSPDVFTTSRTSSKKSIREDITLPTGKKT